MINSGLSRLRSYLTLNRRGGASGASGGDAHSVERQRRVLYTSLSFAAFRGLSLLFPVLTVGLFLEGLGRDVYGLWMTATSFFALFTFADLGLGFGLLTRLSQCFGRDDTAQARGLISSAFLMLSAIAGGLLVVFLVVHPIVPWARLLNASSPAAQRAAAWIVGSVLLAQILQIPLALVQRTQLARQEGYKSNLWQCVGAVINLLVVFLLVRSNAHPFLLVTAACLVPVFAILLNWVHFFGMDAPGLRPSWGCVDRVLARSLLLTGGGYFALQVVLTLGLSLDNLVVAKVCGLGNVADFAIASRVAAVIGGVVSMLSMPMWAANGEAFARGDFLWIRRSCLKLALLSFLLALGASLLLVAFGPWLFERWLGKALVVDRSLLLFCALRETLLAVAAPFFMVLNGAGVVWPQIRVLAAFTVLVTLLKILLAKLMGNQGVALGNAILYGAWVLPWVVQRAAGIWREKGSVIVTGRD